jgi:hypothetical protein
MTGGPGTIEAQPAPALSFLLANTDENERRARIRELRAIGLLYCGRWHPLTSALSEAVSDAGAVDRALSLLSAEPALRRRKLLSAYMALLPGSRR